MAYQTMYPATKAALNALTLALRYEFWDENIHLTFYLSNTNHREDQPSHLNAQGPVGPDRLHAAGL